MIMKKFLLIFLLSFFPLSGFANYANPGDFVAALGGNTIKIIQDKSINEDKKFSMLNNLFEQNVDIDWISKFVLGRYLRSIESDQLIEYQQLYRSYLINSYVPKFKEYTGEAIKIVSVKAIRANESVVETELVNPDNSNLRIRVDYRIRLKNDQYKIIDVVAEGVSMISSQRAEFGEILNNKGIGELIKRLKSAQ